MTDNLLDDFNIVTFFLISFSFIVVYLNVHFFLFITFGIHWAYRINSGYFSDIIFFIYSFSHIFSVLSIYNSMMFIYN